MIGVAAIAAKVGGVLWKLARIVLPIPLGLIVAGGLWLRLDRSSAIRQAVDKATTDLIAGAKIDALEATADAQRRLRMYAEMNAAEARRKAELLEAANKELNDRLEAMGLEGVSKSAFNRKAMRLATAQRRMREGREMFKGLAAEFSGEDVDAHTLTLGEFIKTLIQELVDDSAGLKKPKDAMDLARAYLATVQAQRISTDRRQRLEREMADKAVKAVDTVAKAKGMSADTVERIKAEILGVASER